MSRNFHWCLTCSACQAVFQPEEDYSDPDIVIECPACKVDGLICHGDDHDDDPSSNDSKWPEDLSDEELDSVWGRSGMLPESFRIRLTLEFARRGRSLPGGSA